MTEVAAAEPAAAPVPAANAKKSKSKKAAAPKEPKQPTRTRPPRDTKKPEAPAPIPPQQRATRPKAAPPAAPANPLKPPRNPIVAPIKLPKGKKGLSPGTIVWAKMPGFPWFPGIVADEKDDAVPSKVSAQKPANALKDRVHLVRFTGDRNRVTWGWVPAGLLQTFNESAESDEKIIKNQRYKSQKERREVRTAHRKALAQVEEGGGEAGAKAKAALASKGDDDDSKEDEEMDTAEDGANGDAADAEDGDDKAAASDDKAATSDDKVNGDAKMDEDAEPSSET